MLPFSPTTHLHLVAATFLLACAFQDARQMQIPNIIWFIGAALLLPFRIWVQVVVGPEALHILAWGLGLTIAALIFWGFQAWGGADAKGIILLAWMIPPATIGPVTFHPLLYVLPLGLVGVLAWQKIRPGPAPFYVLLAPLMILAFGLIFIIG